MEKDLVKTLIFNPELLPALLFVATAWFLLRPLVHKLDNLLGEVYQNVQRRRIENFVILIWVIVTFSSSLYCLFLTDFWPRGVRKDLASPFGPEFLRYQVWTIQLAAPLAGR